MQLQTFWKIGGKKHKVFNVFPQTTYVYCFYSKQHGHKQLIEKCKNNLPEV